MAISLKILSLGGEYLTTAIGRGKGERGGGGGMGEWGTSKSFLSRQLAASIANFITVSGSNILYRLLNT